MYRIIFKYKYQIGIATIFVGIILGIILGNYLNDYIDTKRQENYYSISEFVVFILNYFGWLIWFLPGIILCWIVFKFLIIPAEKKNEK